MGKKAKAGDPEKGAKIFKQKCAQCHNTVQGGAHNQGKMISSFLRSFAVLVPLRSKQKGELS